MDPARDQAAVELSIVIPVYNGEASVGVLVKALCALDFDELYEIVLVEDCGQDGSAKLCRGLVTGPGANPRVTLIELARNYGEHNAVMAGLNHARGRFVITMDDDLQNPPEEVLNLYRACKNSDADVVYTYYGEKKHGPLRNLGSWLANKTADIVLDKPKDLYLSTFRCIRGSTVANIVKYDGPYPYVDGLISQSTNRYGRLKVKHLERGHGVSGYTLAKLMRLWMTIFINFSTVPLRLATFFGFALTFIGALVVLGVIIEWLTGDVPQGWTSVIAAVLIFSGAQLVVIGVMGEYVGRIFLYLNKKPQYTIRTINEHAEAGARDRAEPARADRIAV
jgi:undecaprenyl-phosphate 4-deoxy-4-formamido-L-arabinose transferase